MCVLNFFVGGKGNGTVVLVGGVRKGCKWLWDGKCENNWSVNEIEKCERNVSVNGMKNVKGTRVKKGLKNVKKVSAKREKMVGSKWL